MIYVYEIIPTTIFIWNFCQFREGDEEGESRRELRETTFIYGKRYCIFFFFFGYNLGYYESNK